MWFLYLTRLLSVEIVVARREVGARDVYSSTRSYRESNIPATLPVEILCDRQPRGSTQVRGLRDACGGAVVRSWLDLCANMMRTRLCVATPWATLHPILARETSFFTAATY